MIDPMQHRSICSGVVCHNGKQVLYSPQKVGSMKYFLSECEAMGLKIVTLHTSGHADYETINKLVETVNPDEVIPIHTEVPEKLIF